MDEVTQILSSIEQGDRQASEKLLPLVYEELRRLAAHRMAQEPPGQTLQATALVHEAYLRLVDTEVRQKWDHRGHFFAAAAEAMRRILVDNARRKRRPKHGGDQARVELDEAQIGTGIDEEKLLQVHELLDQLAAEDSSKAEVVKQKFFVGLSNAEVAVVLGVSEKTVNRHWRYAKAWLYSRIQNEGGEAQ
jgi:RNA polymerase sigma factor (TIGR02999 family)